MSLLRQVGKAVFAVADLLLPIPEGPRIFVYNRVGVSPANTARPVFTDSANGSSRAASSMLVNATRTSADNPATGDTSRPPESATFISWQKWRQESEEIARLRKGLAGGMITAREPLILVDEEPKAASWT